MRTTRLYTLLALLLMARPAFGKLTTMSIGVQGTRSLKMSDI